LQRFSATFRIAVALASLSVCVLVIAHVFELLPDRQKQIIQIRAVLCESVAISCAAAAAKKDLQHLEATLNLLTQRRPEVLSASIVDRAGNAILTVNPRHDSSSVAAEIVSVPLLADNNRWGELTLRFRPVERGMWGVTSSRMRLIGFITALNCLAFFWYLRRILQHLNPSKVIPPRVRSTLDTFAEGLLVLNRDHRIVLANDAFARTVGERPDDLQGRKIDQLPWQKNPDEPEDTVYPWERALQESTTQTGSFVSLKTIKDFKRTFMVNVAPVIAEDGGCHGVLASFDDVTEIQQRNAVLRQMLAKLEDSREQIRKQNEELKQLATRDPLTACLNRRAFFEVFDSHFSGSQRYEKPLTCILLDVDHFKDVNDQHGHAVGDEVLKHVAEVVRASIRQADQLCRYGGEEFCIALPEQDVEKGYFVANKVREAVQSADIRGLRVTVSLGVTASDLGADTAQRLVQQADEALYAAKRTGRNRVCRWDKMPEQSEMTIECPSHDPTETADQFETIVPFHTVQALFSAMFFRAPSVAEHCRRVADYDPALGIETTQVLVTIAGLIIAWSVLIMVYNLVSSTRKKEVAQSNPWGSRSPEWQIPSPAPEFNYDVPFEVIGDPYDYGLPDAAYLNMSPTPASGD